MIIIASLFQISAWHHSNRWRRFEKTFSMFSGLKENHSRQLNKKLFPKTLSYQMWWTFYLTWYTKQKSWKLSPHTGKLTAIVNLTYFLGANVIDNRSIAKKMNCFFFFFIQMQGQQVGRYMFKTLAIGLVTTLWPNLVAPLWIVSRLLICILFRYTSGIGEQKSIIGKTWERWSMEKNTLLIIFYNTSKKN